MIDQPCLLKKCANTVPMHVDDYDVETGAVGYEYPEGGGMCKSCDEVACKLHFFGDTKQCIECKFCHRCGHDVADALDLYRGDDWFRVDRSHTPCIAWAKGQGFADQHEARVA